MARTKQRALQTCMGDKQVYITTTKQRSSMRQILAAIDHLHKQEFEAAITLAAAAEGQITEGAIRHLFRIMRQKLPKTDHNKVINWLKHAMRRAHIPVVARSLLIQEAASRATDATIRLLMDAQHLRLASPRESLGDL